MQKKERPKTQKKEFFSKPQFTSEQENAVLIVLICILGAGGIVIWGLIKFFLSGGNFF
jgi:hypothetical protein